MPIQNFLWAYMGVQLCGRTNFLWAYNVRPCTPMGVLGVLGVICGRTGRTWAYKGVHGRNIAGAVIYNIKSPLFNLKRTVLYVLTYIHTICLISNCLENLVANVFK